MKYPQRKPISVINTITGEEIRFDSQFDFAKAIKVNRASVTKWNKKRLMKGVWMYKDETAPDILAHREYLLAKPQYNKCKGCGIVITQVVTLCPICNTRQ
jgi:hypothetical protein